MLPLSKEENVSGEIGINSAGQNQVRWGLYKVSIVFRDKQAIIDIFSKSLIVWEGWDISGL